MQVLKAFKDLFASAQCEHSCRFSSRQLVCEPEEVTGGPDLEASDRTAGGPADEGSIFYLNEFGF